MTLKLVWLTDLHLLPDSNKQTGYDTISRLDRALSYIKQHHTDADFCAISGDLTDAGDIECYQHLDKALSACGVPYLPMTGNHDVRETLRSNLALPATTHEHFIQYAINKNGIRIIALDTLADGKSEGMLCKERLSWLKTELERDVQSPTFVFCHHPPEKLYLPNLDVMRLLQGGDEMLSLLNQHQNIKHLGFGHVHRPVSGSFGNLGFTGLRSTTMQAPLPYPEWDWDSFEPVQEAPDLAIVNISAESVVVQLHPFCQAEDDFLG